MWENQVQSLGQEAPLKKEIATHSSILVWKIPWMEEPGRLQSMGLQRVGHNWSDFTSLLQITSKCNIPFHVFILSADSLFCDVQVFQPFLFSRGSVVLLILDQGSVTTTCWPNPDFHQCLQIVLLGHLCSMLSSCKGNRVAHKVPNTIWSSTMHSSTLDSAARYRNCKVYYFTFHNLWLHFNWSIFY